MAPTMRLWWGWLLTAVPIVALSPLLGPGSREGAYVLVATGALAAIVTGVRRHRPARPAGWLLVAAAMASAAAANVIWAMQAVDGTTAGGAVADLAYLLMYALLVLGIAVLAGRPAGTSRWTGTAEAGIVVCTGAILAWILLYDPLVHDPRQQIPLLVMLYPPMDVLLIAMAVRLTVRLGRLNRSHQLLLSATALLTVADVAFFVWAATGASSEGSGLATVGWLTSYAMFGLAVLHPHSGSREAAPRPRAGRARTALLHIALVLVGPAATVYALITDRAEGELDIYDFLLPLGATAVTAVLLVIRMTHAGRIAEQHADTLRHTLDEQAALQESLRHSTLHDALTGLPNRRRLEEEITRAAQAGPGALFLLDLDGFKDVNDRLGHSFGDEMLVAVAARLRGLLGPGDVLSRPGGDEFGILVRGADAAEVTARGEAFLAALRRPVEVDGHALHITGSTGVRTLDPEATATQMLGDADLALYAAKAAGKDCAVRFDARLRQEQADRVRVVERLRHALIADEFAVHYQPIVALGSGAPVAVEALVRWLPPGRAPIGPDRFIPAAEDSGLIIGLGEWVLRQACFDAAGWHTLYGTTLTVNVSPRQLSDPEFVAKVRRALTDSDLPAHALTLEITEGMLVRSGAQTEQALAALTVLRADGVRVAVDDFGTGYSSLAYLRDLPIDLLKIDKSFMPANAEDTRQAALVRAVIDLARSLGLTTVAEGVETLHHADLLRDLGCDRGQGYLFARPAPAGKVTLHLAAGYRAYNLVAVVGRHR